MKNIIFDVGDVLIEYRWEEMLREHGLDEKKLMATGAEMFNSPVWRMLDSGRIDVEGAILQYQKQFPEFAEDIAWFLRNAELMSVPREDVWERIPKLKEKGYKIYLLSNYSKELFEKHTKGAAFHDLLDGGIISYQVKCLKPEPEIYLNLIEKYDLEPEECLFFDDREENVEGAKAVGMHSEQVLSRKWLVDRLDELLK